MVLAGLLAIVILTFTFMVMDATDSLPSWDRNRVNKTQKSVVSKDGATIAFEQSGSGPAIVLVSAALADRDGAAKLARLLAPDFTVLNYDRRGRGSSTDHQPYAVEREVEDIEALMDSAGGPAYLFGSSSGSVLALEAANKLGRKTKGVVMFEPPFIIDGSRPPMPEDLSQQIDRLVADNRRDDAAKHFFTHGMGIPPVFVTLMRLLMPGWSKMAAMTHTIRYDLAVLVGTQAGKPLPADRWASVQSPVLVLVGSRSEPFFHSGAKSLARILRNAQYRPLEGRDHSAVLMAPQDLAAAIKEYFRRP